MANNILTLGQITREGLRLFKNSNAFLKNINTQYDDQFARDGAKIGSQLKIRLPNDYAIRSGPTAVPQDTKELVTTLVINGQKGVDVSFSSADLSLSIQDFGERILKPMMNKLGGAIARDVMSTAEMIPSLVHNTDSSGNTISPIAKTWLDAGALLDLQSADRGDRKIVMDPLTQSATVSSLAGLFNARDKISSQYAKGTIGMDVLGFDWMMDQTVIKHTTGLYGVLPTVNGAGQSGTSIVVTATAGPINYGDIISFVGVYGINPVTGDSTGVLRQFSVTANVPAGSTSIPIYPSLNPPVIQAGLSATAYQTVTNSPANGTQVTSPVLPGEVYRKNIAFLPEAFTFATADMFLPEGVHKAARENFDGVSMRLVQFYTGMSDQLVTRLDVLYGFLSPRPEWAVVVADKL